MSNSNLEVNEINELKDLTKCRLHEINKIKDYFNAEIKERKDIIRKISKYTVAFDYADCIVWHFKYCFICNGCWNTCRNSWSTFNSDIYHNDWWLKHC